MNFQRHAWEVEERSSLDLVDLPNPRFVCFHFYGFVHFQYSVNYDRSGGGPVILALIGFG